MYRQNNIIYYAYIPTIFVYTWALGWIKPKLQNINTSYDITIEYRVKGASGFLENN